MGDVHEIQGADVRPYRVREIAVGAHKLQFAEDVETHLHAVRGQALRQQEVRPPYRRGRY